jgi:hypothetical protein
MRVRGNGEEGGSTVLEEALCLLTVRKTGAGAPLREAPKLTIITEDWVKCALKSIYVPYGAPASEKIKGACL